MAEKKDDKKAQASIVQVPTQMGFAFKLEDESIVSNDELLLRMYNMLLDVKKAVA